MSTISYPYLPAGAHQPDAEHLQCLGCDSVGHLLIHCGEPMHAAGSNLCSIYTPMTTEPERGAGIGLEVYLRSPAALDETSGQPHKIQHPTNHPAPIGQRRGQ
jgi:hypothetical protein